MAHAIENTKPLRNESISTIGRLWNQMIEYVEFNRYGVYAVLLLWCMCLGGVAVGVGAMTSPVALTFLAFPTMALLTWILAIQPMKYVMSMAILVTVIDLCVIAYYLI